MTAPQRYAGTAPRRFVTVALSSALACPVVGAAVVVGSLRLQRGTERLTGRSAEGPHPAR